MELYELKEYFKLEFNSDCFVSIGKIDNNKEKAICFYNSERINSYSPVIGGKANKSTTIKPITILLRYTKNKKDAELMAKRLYEFFEERTFYINKKRIFTIMTFDEPNDLGTDENNVYEYSIELDFYVER